MARIPNEEVEKAVEKCLENNYTSTKKSVSKCVSKELKKNYNENDVEDPQRKIVIGKKIDSKQFNHAINIVREVLKEAGTSINIGNYDGLIVKQLKDNNVARQNSRNSDQTHMEFTGNQKYIFPFLTAREYFDPSQPENFDSELSLLSNILKNYFLLKIPISLKQSNLCYLENNEIIDVDEIVLNSYSTVLLDNRDRIEISSQLEEDGPYFEKLRDLLKIDDYFILLKQKEQLSYEAYGIKSEGIVNVEKLADLKDKFFCQDTITVIDDSTFNGFIDDFIFNRESDGKNRLLYGVPGCGKSWTIKNIICKDVNEFYMERVVFHPDYTYSDFIGQILPKIIENGVDYKFEAGPFTNIVKKAYENPSEEFFLIIEEINRGNAPAIFGDIFQLLDRKKEDGDGFKKGTSEFGVTNSEIANEIYGDEKRKVRIPSNLNIIATMNTSDQNVFTLDTAFKRRWHMEMIKNDFKKPEFYNTPIPNTVFTWEVFGTAINEIILEDSKSTLSSEDKRLGAFFVDENDLGSAEQFAEKVLMYLWDDVFKFSREQYFDESAVNQFSLEEFINAFVKEESEYFINIFTKRINSKLHDVNTRLKNLNGFAGKENDSN